MLCGDCEDDVKGKFVPLEETQKKNATRALLLVVAGWLLLGVAVECLTRAALYWAWNDSEEDARERIGMAAAEAYDNGVRDGRVDAARILAKRDAEKKGGKTHG